MASIPRAARAGGEGESGLAKSEPQRGDRRMVGRGGDEEAGLEGSQEAEVGAEWGLVRGWWGPEANEEGSVVNWAAG